MNQHDHTGISLSRIAGLDHQHSIIRRIRDESEKLTHSVSHVHILILETIAEGTIDPRYLRHLCRFMVESFRE